MIPIYKPSITELEKKYVNDCLDTGWISANGPYVTEFEEAFAEKINSKYALTVCNGTLAIHLALMELDIEEGDEVIVPTFTYIASVNPIKYCGATPIFVDSLQSSWQINPNDVRKKITNKTKAIIVVHLYGQPCEMTEINKLAKEHNLFVIEDCAEAFGSYYKHQHVGTFGDIGTFSFFGNKTITTGEGGMLTFNNETLYQRALHIKGQGLAKHRQYWHDIIGNNFRMTNIACAIGKAQLERSKELLERKREIAHTYERAFNGTHVFFHSEQPNSTHSYWMNSVYFDCTEKQRDYFREHLKENGVDTRPLFYPVHTMPMYSKKYENHPVAENISRRGFNIPSYPDLTENELAYIIENILNYKFK